VITTGTITTGSEYGQLRYMQDDQAGIAAYGAQLASFYAGDSVVITGVISKYRGELQLSPVLSVDFIASGRHISTLSLDNLEDSSDPEFESRKVIFTCMGIASCEPNLSGGWYTLYDQQGNIARLSVAEGQDIAGFLISDSPYTIEGIWTKFEDQFQLKCQDLSDASEGSCHFISPPQLSFVGDTPHLFWETIGLLEGSEVWINDGHQNYIIAFSPTSESIEAIPDFLEPGILYEARLTQLDSTNTIFHSVPVDFSVPAPDAPPIEILFNRSVNATFSDGSHPLATGSSVIETDIISRIDQVQATLDIAMYNTSRTTIVQAVSRAVQRGVVVRYIADDETSNSALSGSLSFPVLFRSGDGIMHNKFVIADAEDPDRAWIWTGSTNFSSNQLSTDPNHAYIIHDAALAKNYKKEFDEMWGQQPDLTVGRYGDFKTNNTSHLFQIGQVNIESYFSPSDETNCHILDALQSTDHHVEIGLLLLTHDELIDEIIRLHQNGVEVRVILEDEESSTNAVARLRQAGVPLVIHDFGPIFHHKYAIIDEGYQDSDPQVISGSHNWTWSADNINDENTLILHDQSIANIFRQEFEARWAELYTTSLSETIEESLLVYPNPASDYVTINNSAFQYCVVELIDLHGRIVKDVTIDSNKEKRIGIKDLPSGIYTVQIHWPRHQANSRLVILN
jgi:phosphatidylserine/phosphatidylglycerophosphate/cardiolipin synthase-like enzyme